jgi:hypothetical protein
MPYRGVSGTFDGVVAARGPPVPSGGRGRRRRGCSARMDRTRIRWRNVGRLAAAVGGAGLLVGVVPGLVEPPEPKPLPADVGLATPAGAYAYEPPGRARGGRSEGDTRGRGPRDGRERQPRPSPERPRRRPTVEPDAGPPPKPAPESTPEPAPAPDPAPAPAPAPEPAPTPAPEPAPAPAPPPAPSAPPAPSPPPAPEPEEPSPPAPDDEPDPPRGPAQFGFEH